MKKNVLMIDDCDKYLYPEGINTLEEFIEYAENADSIFLEIRKLDEDFSFDPYYIAGKEKQMFINIANVESVQETSVEILTQEEYDARIMPIIDELCTECMFDGDPDMGCDSVENKRDKIDIDSRSCWANEDGEFDPDDDPFDPDDGRKKGKNNIYLFKGRNDEE